MGEFISKIKTRLEEHKTGDFLQYLIQCIHTINIPIQSINRIPRLSKPKQVII